MAERRVYIHAAAALGPLGDHAAGQRRVLSEDPPPLALRELARAVLGRALRQGSHFIELAAIGARLCLERLARPPPADTAVYLGTGLGEVRKTYAVFEQLMPGGPGLISPVDFINAANNMAAFHVARLSGFEGRNLTVSCEGLSAEWALRLACDDLRHGAVPAALVGGVDESFHPRANHMRYFPLRADQRMGQGSGWLYLSPEVDNARGELLWVEELTAGEDDWVQKAIAFLLARIGTEKPQLLPGYRLSPQELAALASGLGKARVENYLEYCGCFPTAASFGLAQAFERAAGLYVHVNRDEDGRRLMLVGLRVW